MNSILIYGSTNNSENTDSTSNNNNKINFDELKKINSSCFAWIIVNGTNISYPIVQYTNNEYYLSHLFDNSSNSSGWIYADYRNTCDGYDKNLIIYGHNRVDKSMFGTLKSTLNDSWYNNSENLTINLYTPYGLEQYRVFSVYTIKAETYYLTTSFLSDTVYETFLNELKNRSIHNFNVDITSKDKILTLSTCSSNDAYRVVLHAKKVT